MVNLIGLLIPFLGTMLGSAFVFFMKKDMPDRLQKALLGFASGVMVAASVWSLLIPAIEAFQPLHHRLCPHDGPRCGVGLTR